AKRRGLVARKPEADRDPKSLGRIELPAFDHRVKRALHEPRRDRLADERTMARHPEDARDELGGPGSCLDRRTRARRGGRCCVEDRSAHRLLESEMNAPRSETLLELVRDRPLLRRDAKRLIDRRTPFALDPD